MSDIFHRLCNDSILNILLYLPLSDFLNCNVEDPDLRSQWLAYHTRIETSCGDTEYRVHKKLHREDGPAVVTSYRETWFFNGNLHRIGGPATHHIGSPQFGEWYKHGKRHREDGGPALREQYISQWWYEGRLFRADGGPTEVNTKYNWESWHDLDGELHRDDGPAIIQFGFRCHWKKHGVLHRVGGPAVEYGDGENEWWEDGERHRLDGPAIDLKDRKVYYRKGRMHREDGPAVASLDTFTSNKWHEAWYIDGKQVNARTRKPFGASRKSMKRSL
jgi:hypothetical protein